jgi:hypothetical protein
MRRLIWAALLLTLTVLGVLAQEIAVDARPQPQIDQEHTHWMQHVMRSLSTIKPGMTRKDLSRILDTDGGLSFRAQGRFVYRRCPYIKVDVEFSPVDEDANSYPHWNPDDKIIKISRPYLEYPSSD